MMRRPHSIAAFERRAQRQPHGIGRWRVVDRESGGADQNLPVLEAGREGVAVVGGAETQPDVHRARLGNQIRIGQDR
ncbi:hypothetical protein [Mesorhizobium delmotii]|uniref:hypothetical protein n=1 Tax=Mesorhizobium delmotii TaxID=1631247 RepID=UPI0010580452|nr:hypothetical protein [Mesorhizobium delmotii]